MRFFGSWMLMSFVVLVFAKKKLSSLSRFKIVFFVDAAAPLHYNQRLPKFPDTKWKHFWNRRRFVAWNRFYLSLFGNTPIKLMQQPNKTKNIVAKTKTHTINKEKKKHGLESFRLRLSFGFVIRCRWNVGFYLLVLFKFYNGDDNYAFK